MSADWQLTCWYLLMLAVVVALAKLTSLGSSGKGHCPARIDRSFFLAPSLCLPSWRKRGDLPEADKWRLPVASLVPVVFIVLFYCSLVPEMRRFPWWLQSYLAVVPFWLLLEALSGLCRICWLPSGRLVPPINHRPWLAKGPGEFWGRRWNLLFGDWLRQMIFLQLRRTPRLALFATFLSSGLLHELLVSLPYQVVYGRSLWGWLTAYFLLQYLAVLLERWLRPGPVAGRLLLWGAVIGPAPLVLNPGTLLIFHLTG